MICCFVLSMPLCAQNTSNLRVKDLLAGSDSLKLDSLSIIPATLIVTLDGTELIDTSDYYFYPAISLLVFKDKEWFAQNIKGKSIRVSYRVFPFKLDHTFSHKPLNLINTYTQEIENPFVYRYENKTEDVFKWGSITKSGNISRGVSFGNNQDVVVNSSLNLQLSGYLSEEIQVLAAITDNNIPIQPDGNTQQIQEFDKVFIQLFNNNHKLIAGDFELQRPESYFMNYYKKAQGAYLSSHFLIPSKKSDKKNLDFNISASGALSKGRYARNVLTAIEGNQGPYKLTGVNNENYIIVLAGTERVYIDGIELTRGQEYDYTIDYNLGEVTFMPKNVITKDKRLVVEFEYTDRYYARTLFTAGAAMKYQNLSVNFNFFSEQDLRNQPLLQELTENDKQILYNVGDSIHQALVPNVDSIAYNTDMVLYAMIDTIVDFVLYDSVFVFSTSPDSAFYKLGFSYMGPGRGNYILVQSSANGRVFQWVAPQNGLPSGDYEPLTLLISPKRKQMYTLGVDYKWGKTTRISVEAALSDYNLNTFSSQHKKDDMGYAVKAEVSNEIPFAKKSKRNWKFVSALSNEYSDRHFEAIEPYRPVEFKRDWNFTITDKKNENMAGLKLGIENKNNQFAIYRLRYFTHGAEYTGMINQLDIAADYANFYLNFTGSYLYTSSPYFGTRYLKQKATLQKKFKWMIIGIREEQEHNLFIPSAADTLMPNSFAFNIYEAFISSPDSAKNKYSLSYAKRYDYLPMNNSLEMATHADDINLNAELARNPRNVLKAGATYRMLRINDSALALVKPDKLLLGRIEFYTRKFKNVITSTTYYEVGSGMEEKKEYSYVEVPPGQGVYVWNDYNGDGLKQLNEFDVAVFKDQANYIRVFTPTNEYISTYSNRFSESLIIEPGNAWAGKKGFKKFVSRFSLLASYSVSRKSSDKNFARAYNPFNFNLTDSSLISASTMFKSSLFFNKGNPKIGMEVSYQLNNSKVLLLNGFESRSWQYYGAKIRWNITRKFYTNLSFTQGRKEYDSEFFSSRDYNIAYLEVSPQFIVQPNNKFRISLNYSYTDKLNKAGSDAERALSHNVGIEMKYNFPGKGSLQARANYINIKYNGAGDNALAYEMLAGFKPGQNITWNFTFQRNIANNLQLDLLYDGRKTGTNKMVHVGSVQLRAYF